MQRATSYDPDLLYTDKGHFGITNLDEEVEENMVIVVLAGAEELCMLREKWQEGSRWHEFVDSAYMNHMKEYIAKSDKGEVIERLKIR